MGVSPVRSVRVALVAVVTMLLTLATAVPIATAAPLSGTLDAVQARFADRDEIAWDTTLCSGVPVSYVGNVLLGVGLADWQVEHVTSVLEAELEDVQPAPYGVTVFQLHPTLDAVATRATYQQSLLVDLHLNHVFFFDPFLRYSPESAPERLIGDYELAEVGAAERRVVVIDTGYALHASAPEGYVLAPGSRVYVDEFSPTAHHGPFIASQIARMAPGDVTLQRVLAEEGWMPSSPGPGAEAVFDEVALLHTLKAADLDEAVVNLSFGTYGCEWYDEPVALGRALDAERADNGAIFVAAAGNDETGWQHYPAAFSGGLDPAVFAVGAHDGNLSYPRRACFSNFGAISTWAPGVAVLGYIPTATGPELAEANGTSFAAPHVTAALAAGAEIDEVAFGLMTIVDDRFGHASASGTAC